MSWVAIRVAAAALATLTFLLPGGSAHAEGKQVVVLPMTSTAKSLRLYERAIASALAQALQGSSGASVHAVASVSEVPKSARLIIEGRLIAKGKGRVFLEARLREASTGRALATLATAATNITNLDTLVAKLAGRLSPVIRAALAPKPPIPLPVVHASESDSLTASPTAASAIAPQPPDILLIPAGGSAARGVVSVQEPATASARAMLARLGLQAAISKSFVGLQDVPGALTELKRSGAKYVLMIRVREVSFSYRAVLSARGTVQVALFSSDGELVFARTVSTDTVVGSRGDRHQALVFQVASQAMDMLLPEFRRLVPGRKVTGG